VDRLERLVNLVAALLDAGRPLTREELRQRVGGYSDDPGAFRRNFERDKDILRQMGLPLVTETLDGGMSEDQAGYRIPRELYELPDPGLSESELAALRMAGAAVRLEGPWGSDPTTSALRKLSASGAAPAEGVDGRNGESGAAPAEGEDGRNGESGAAPAAGVGEASAATGRRNGTGSTGVGRARGAGTEQLAELDGGDAVVVVFGAIAERRRVELTYRGETRRVDPWHLSYRRGKWYLSGFDHRRGSERLYRLDRVEGAVVAGGPAGAYSLPAGGASDAPPAWRLGDQPEQVARVLVDAVQAPWAAASVGEGAVAARHDDGSIEVELAFTNQDALLSWVFGFLDHAEVIGPPELRALVIARLEALAGITGSKEEARR
jgi:proteasome accessory factor B